jgi:hypothetical protein
LSLSTSEKRLWHPKTNQHPLICSMPITHELPDVHHVAVIGTLPNNRLDLT